jgi:para-nitrobenzyl esterase
MTSPVVRTRAGRVSGTPSPDGWAFLGIPYAAPPALAGRFAAPRAHPPWDGIRQATRYGATALQSDRADMIIPEPLIPGDNCLNLNVFTPSCGGDRGGDRLPVLFWIHGGGFFGGCGASPWYTGKGFNRDGTVVVTINYRLGAEGFLMLRDVPPNRAVLDWLAALRWVQDNIAAFGGDPDRVTIAGQSAGGWACATLLAVPAAAGLFRGAICMSGSVGADMSAPEAEEVARTFAAHLGVEPTAAALENVPPRELLDAQQKLLGQREVAEGSVDSLAKAMASVRLPFAPVVDGSLLPRDARTAVAAGAAKNVPVMAGATENEFNMVLRGHGGWITRDVVTKALGAVGFTESGAERFLTAHRGKPPAEVAAQAMTDTYFRVPAQQLLAAQHAAGGAGYGYEFRWAPTATQRAGLAFHCLDIPFAFDLLDAHGVAQATGEGPPRALADTVHSAFARFVQSGEPGWPAYDERRQMQIFDLPSRVAEDPLAAERALWDSPGPA